MNAKPLLEVCERLIAWLDRLAKLADEGARNSRNFITLKEAHEADARTYRATANDIRKAIKKAGAA